MSQTVTFHLIIVLATIIVAISTCPFGEGSLTNEEMFKEFLQSSSSANNHGDFNGTKWAVLVAGSNEYYNYRHQADICHAYQIMKRNGLNDENIIVFMYDDIAYHASNPRKGVIINNPHGENVYPDVPKDYTGKTVNPQNLYAVLLGNETAVKGGSGKVLKSGPNDLVFIYYADHGGPGVLGMPDEIEMVYANDLMHVLKKMHASKTYKKMLIYVEACESGSMFDGLLPRNMSIYVTTAANPEESSFATYCGDDVPVPKGYEGTCLGDVYSISWMEDSDKRDPTKETLEEQYNVVKKRTGSAKGESSHVMQYGEISLNRDFLSLYFVGNYTKDNHIHIPSRFDQQPLVAIDQRDVDLLYFNAKVNRAPKGSNEWMDAQKQLDEVISHREHVDRSVTGIVEALSGGVRGFKLLTEVRPPGQPLVDDWDCLKTMVRIYEANCGNLKSYGKKYMRGFANLCNAGVQMDQMAQVSAQVCHLV